MRSMVGKASGDQIVDVKCCAKECRYYLLDS
jgi:hypothetical protein